MRCCCFLKVISCEKQQSFLLGGWRASVFCAASLKIKTTHLKEAVQAHPMQVL